MKCELKFEFCVDFLVSASINREFVISERGSREIKSEGWMNVGAGHLEGEA